MRISKVCISNFRALQNLPIEFSNMTVIIGENDCGKTSVMLALKAFFENKKLDSPDDYFKHKTDNPVVIEVCFKDIRDRFKEFGINADSEAIIKRTFRFNEKTTNELLVNGVWTEISEKKLATLLPDFVLVPADRNLQTHAKMTTTSLFGKLFRPLVKQIVEQEGAQSATDLQDKIRSGVAKRVSDLQDAMREQLNNPELNLSHDVEVDPLQGIEIPVAVSDERVEDIPIENRGAGVQNSFILALFRTYAKYQTPDFILAIEEPENSLHPRAQREMRWAMQDLSHASQVICTTHSPVFLDLGRLEDNIVLRRRSDGATEPAYFCLEGEQERNQLRELIGIKVSDALLGGGGNCTLIVEGETELYAYPHLFRCIGLNPRSLGISLISAGGSDVEKMSMHARILNAYNLPCIIVLDKNKEKEAEELRAKKIPNVKAVYVLQKGNFEEYLPKEITVEVINELCLKDLPDETRKNVQQISVFDIDESKPIENQLRKLVHEKYVGERFAFLKLPLGQEVGKRMVERKIRPHDEIIEILNKAKEIALA
ncbi:MAG: AAA family ATPase [Sedimentisphaerales bacterium]|jgi:predicted ATP-dependent endonuclease of OLD family